jgi:hypothetical protein
MVAAAVAFQGLNPRKKHGLLEIAARDPHGTCKIERSFDFMDAP